MYIKVNRREVKLDVEVNVKKTGFDFEDGDKQN